MFYSSYFILGVEDGGESFAGHEDKSCELCDICCNKSSILSSSSPIITESKIVLIC